MKAAPKMSSSSAAAVYEVTSEHARITQPNSATPDYFSIPWNDDFSTENRSIVSLLHS